MKIKKILLTIAILISPFLIPFVNAAGTPPPLPCGGPFPPCPIPLDNGVWLLLIAGLAYGGKKIYDSLKKNPA
jgi:hypothetical protein